MQHLEDLSLLVDGSPSIAPCIEIVLIADGPFERSKRGYQAIFDDFRAKWGAELRLCSTYDDQGMRPYVAAEWSDVSDWMQTGSVAGSASFGAHFQAGSSETNASPPMFDAVCMSVSAQDSVSGCRIALPVSVLSAGVQAMEDLFASYVSGIELRYAFCGFGLAWNAEYHDVERQFRLWAVPRLLRHPGLSNGDYMPFVLHARRGLLSVSWLTAIGPATAALVGGLEALRRSLPAECPVSKVGRNALVIRAGATPSIGDVNRRDNLPYVRVVAHALRPAWCPDDLLEQINVRPIPIESSARWLRRHFT